METVTVTFSVDLEVLQDSDFQDFVRKLEQSQHIEINLDEYNETISIKGKQTSVNTAQKQTKTRIVKMSLSNNNSGPILSAAKKNFLQYYGRNYLDSIKKTKGISNASFENGNLQLKGDTDAINSVKAELDQSLYEHSISIPSNVAKHLTRTSYGSLLIEFSKKYRVGTSLEPHRRPIKPAATKTVGCGNIFNRGAKHGNQQCGRGKQNFNNQKQNNIPHKFPTTKLSNDTDDDDDDDDKSSQTSDSDTSLSTAFTNMSTTSNSCISLTPITLCSNDIIALQEAKEELQNYSIHSEILALTADEYAFILKQKSNHKNQTSSSSIKDRCLQIRYYLNVFIKNMNVHMFVSYSRGIWSVAVKGFKSDVSPAMLRIKNHLGSVVKAEVQIQISKLIAYFISKKASSTIEDFEKTHNITIKPIPPPNNHSTTHATNEQDENKYCLKLIGSSSNINAAQAVVEDFLGDLSESEHELSSSGSHFPTEVGNNINEYLRKIEESDDYDAVSSLTGIKLQIVTTNRETINEIIQQCEEIIGGYHKWTATPDEYQQLSNVFFVKKQPSIDQFQKQWNTRIYLRKENRTIHIYARSKAVAQEIEEVLRNMASGKGNQADRISKTILIDFVTRRFLSQFAQSIFNEAQAKKISIDTKNRGSWVINGHSGDVKSIEQKIETLINDIKQKLVTTRLQLSAAESELFRSNSYEIPIRLERETNTHILDIKFCKKYDHASTIPTNDTISTLKCIVNNRGQSIAVKRGDIMRLDDVDAIAKSSTTGEPSSERIIYIDVPKSRHDRSALLTNIISGLKFAEMKHYTSLALPFICTKLSDSSLRHNTKTTILAIKKFYVDNPQSCLKKIIIIDNDEAICDSFASELLNDHTNEVIDREIRSIAAKWSWLDDRHREVLYSESDTQRIETEFQRYIRTFEQTNLELCVNQARETHTIYYVIQFDNELKQLLADNRNALDERLECGYQINKNTYTPRTIVRQPLKQEEHQRKSLDAYQQQIEIPVDDWDIIGITNPSVEQAKAEMKKIIQTATVTDQVTVNLLQDIDTHKNAIRNIAMQNSIEVNFKADQRDKLTIVLAGLRPNVSQAKPQILSYIHEILITTLANNKDKKDDDLSVPKEWTEQEEECILVEIVKNDPEFDRIERRMKETMQSIKIHKIERIQNIHLWNQYAFQRRTLRRILTEKSSADIEMELFHGTRNTSPADIYSCIESGIDMRYCDNGLWGKGSYFAKNASYSCQSYAYKLSNGQRQVLLASVLTGDAYDYGTKTDSSLRMPPKKDPKISKLRYNSVTGETGGSRVYVVYNNHLSYPAFLITFTY